MSIVPYNSNSDILYHNPDDGVLILHDPQQNSIQLLSTLTLDSEQPRRPPQERTIPSKPYDGASFKSYPEATAGHKCPNCGFTWDEYETSRGLPRRDSAVGDMHTHTRVKGTLTGQVDGGKINLPRAFMHRDYFKLLSQIPHNRGHNKKHVEEGETEEGNGKGSFIPEGVFNQGYFKRFFRKVAPYILGSGAHAQVYKVEHVLNDIVLGTYAVKRISVGDKYELLEQVVNEVLILYELSAKNANESNLIRYNHVWLELGDLDDSSAFILPTSTFDNAKPQKVPYMFILQQYCDGGHLEDLISKNYATNDSLSYSERVLLERRRRKDRRTGNTRLEKPKWLSNFEIWKFFHDVATGVNYLHKHGILHRDLKPSNCLMDVKYTAGLEIPNQFDNVETLEQTIFDLPKVLVSDFGEGKFIDKHKNSRLKNSDRQGNTGTLEFTAPELWIYSGEISGGGHGGGDGGSGGGVGAEKSFVNDFTYESDIYSLGLILCYLCTGSLPFASLVKGENDPQVARDAILNWYESLTLESYGDWFKDRVVDIQDSFDECMESFMALSFEMIRGTSSDIDNASTGRCGSKEVLLMLNEIKLKYLVRAAPNKMMNSPVSVNPRAVPRTDGLTLYYPHANGLKERDDPTEVAQNSASEAVEEDDDLMFEKEQDVDHFNLTEEEHEAEIPPPQPHLSDFGKRYITSVQMQRLPFYCIELLILEYLSTYSPHYSQTALKVLIYVTIGLDMFLEEFQYMQSGIFIAISVGMSIQLGYAIGCQNKAFAAL